MRQGNLQLLQVGIRDTNAPLFCAIAISEMYIGQTMDTMPIPKPPIILYITKSVNPTHSAQPIAEMLNRTEAMNIVFFCQDCR
jgi:hypothetical protein